MSEVIYINKGTTQEERLPALLLPENVRIDDRDTAQLMSFLADYARLINYYSLDEQQHLLRDGDWSFFARQPVFILSKIASSELQRDTSRFHLAAEVLGKTSESLVNKTYALRLLFEVLGNLIQHIQIWSRNYPEMPPVYQNEFATVIENTLVPLLIKAEAADDYYTHRIHLVTYPFFERRKVLGTLDKALWKHLQNPDLIKQELEALWEKGEGQLLPVLKAKHKQNESEKQSEKQNENEEKRVGDESEKQNEGKQIGKEQLLQQQETRVNNTYVFVLSLVQDFINGLNHLARLAGKALERELTERSDLRPDVALISAFLDLFGSVRDKMNANTGRHLDFYYRRILQLEPDQFIPDTTYVSFQLVPNVPSFPIEAGLLLDAGKDTNGLPLVFKTTQASNLSQIQVKDIRNFTISRNPLIQPGTKDALITGIYQSQNVPVLNPGDAAWPVFGEDQVAYGDDQRSMQDAVLGFALASKVLLMNSGSRSVQMTLLFTPESFSSCLLDLLDEIATATQTNPNKAYTSSASAAIFEKVFSNGLQVDVSAKTGWLSLVLSRVTYDPAAASMTLELEVPEAAPPLVAYDEKLHGPGYTTPYPVIRCLLVNRSPYAIYNFLNGLILRTAILDVSVKNCRDLVLYNQYGRIDASKPFQPFGSQPERGSYFMLGNNEVFIKDTRSVQVYMEWIQLPENGFADYYKGYDLQVDNTSYEVQFSCLRDYSWQQPRALQKPYTLFQEQTSDTPSGPVTSLMAVSTYSLQVPAETFLCNGIQPSDLNVPLVYDQNTGNGFFKMQLTAPPFGFGASLYNNVLSQTILNNTINKQSNDLPNPPFTPIAGSVTMDYSARDEITFQTFQGAKPSGYEFYHIDAFTQYPITASATPPQPSDGTPDNGTQEPARGGYKALLPSYANDGYLYLGLSNVTQAEPLSLLFYFTQKEIGETIQLPEVQWSYLYGNEWYPFQRGNSLHDDTSSFMQSGIITFDLPDTGTASSTLLPAGLFWIRAEVPGNVDLFGNISGIYAQVVQASFVPDAAGNQRSSLTLPAGTIKRTIQSIPQIKSIQQPFSSFGGVLPETRNDFYVRVSERLRHKQRAITVWDFERIALQGFAGIYKAKAYTNSNLPTTKGNRRVELMVIPYVDADGTATTDMYAPVFGFTMLEQIKLYLQQYASPHLEIQVRNPVYERLMIRCQVKFNNSSPFYIQRLNEDIALFLSPWISEHKRLNSSGDSIQKSSILGYIQQLDYVDFVTAFSIVKITNVDGVYHFDDTARDTSNGDVLYALTPWSVFVSAENHLIESIDQKKYEEPQRTGINNLTIGHDFIVTPDPVTAPLTTLKASPANEQNPRYLV